VYLLGGLASFLEGLEGHLEDEHKPIGVEESAD
jgi:hypothetical protein